MKQEIELCYMKKEITKRQRDALVRHMSHHTAAHIKKMLTVMKDGKTFLQAHKIALNTIGK